MKNTFMFKPVLGAAILAAALATVGCASSGQRTFTEKVSDRMTVAHVEDALNKAPLYKYNEVTVTAMNGDVELGGTVGTPEQQKQAAQIASGVEGVRRVFNYIRVEPATLGNAPIITPPQNNNNVSSATPNQPPANQQNAPSYARH